MKGRIIRGIGGFYYVHAAQDGQVYECRAKGIFRKDKLRPLPGDQVEIAALDQEKLLGNIEEVYPRKNVLIRPAVANVDQALVIFAMASPKPNDNLLDRFLVMMETQGIGSIILFNKTDLADSGSLEEVRNKYKCTGYPLLFASAIQNEGLEQLRALLRGKTTTVAGPSGVGKSSLLNILQDSMYLETGAVSEKIERGRHTTRHTELLYVEEDTYILDTPGFSSVELSGFEKEELGQYFPEIRKREQYCRFAGCAHVKEPDCEVRKALREGRISDSRYENYCIFYEELKNRKRYQRRES